MENVQKFKIRLEEQQKELVDGLGYLKKEDPFLLSDHNTNNTLDDAITEIEGHDRITATRLQMKQNLTEVVAALKRIEDGTYGICTNCGETIPENRLEAMPNAKLCLKCGSKK